MECTYVHSVVGAVQMLVMTMTTTTTTTMMMMMMIIIIIIIMNLSALNLNDLGRKISSVSGDDRE